MNEMLLPVTMNPVGDLNCEMEGYAKLGTLTMCLNY
jgi:hypothetical protein